MEYYCHFHDEYYPHINYCLRCREEYDEAEANEADEYYNSTENLDYFPAPSYLEMAVVERDKDGNYIGVHAEHPLTQDVDFQ